jgi:transposase
MDRYIGLDAHASSCTFAVLSASGRRLRTDVVETHGQALVEYLQLLPGQLHLCMEEGALSSWLYELLSPHVEELVVVTVGISRGDKSDAKDAWGLAEALRIGAVKTRVYKDQGAYGKLREVGRVYTKIVEDHARVQNRLKALFRSRGVSALEALFKESKQEEFVKQLPAKMRVSAEILLAQYSAILEVRSRAHKELLQESRKHEVCQRLQSCPGIGPIRAALLVGIVVSPHRFRTQRQFWSYCGLGIVMRSSSDWKQDRKGQWVKSKEPLCRGLNPNHNRTLKWIFKGAATTIITGLPNSALHADYQRLLEGGTKPPLAKLTLARKVSATVLSMWKNQEAYDPSRSRQNPQQAERQSTGRS